MNTARHLLEFKSSPIWSIEPEKTVFEALHLMAEKQVGALLVLEGDKLVGIVSERDYARKVILNGRSSRETLVKEIMSFPVITVHPEQTVQECMEVMTNNHIRHLPVVEGETLLGVISIGDVVRDLIYTQRKTISSLEDKLLGQS